jgi:hypothetical protein
VSPHGFAHIDVRKKWLRWHWTATVTFDPPIPDDSGSIALNRMERSGARWKYEDAFDDGVRAARLLGDTGLFMMHPQVPLG